MTGPFLPVCVRFCQTLLFMHALDRQSSAAHSRAEAPLCTPLDLGLLPFAAGGAELSACPFASWGPAAWCPFPLAPATASPAHKLAEHPPRTV